MLCILSFNNVKYLTRFGPCSDALEKLIAVLQTMLFLWEVKRFSNTEQYCCLTLSYMLCCNTLPYLRAAHVNIVQYY